MEREQLIEEILDITEEYRDYQPKDRIQGYKDKINKAIDKYLNK